jgi:hypothetical protein
MIFSLRADWRGNDEIEEIDLHSFINEQFPQSLHILQPSELGCVEKFPIVSGILHSLGVLARKKKRPSFQP